MLPLPIILFAIFMLAFFAWGIYSYFQLVKKVEERQRRIQNEIIPEVADYLNNNLDIPATISEDKMGVIVDTKYSTSTITYERNNVFHLKTKNKAKDWAFTMDCEYYDVLCVILSKILTKG